MLVGFKKVALRNTRLLSFQLFQGGSRTRLRKFQPQLQLCQIGEFP